MIAIYAAITYKSQTSLYPDKPVSVMEDLKPEMRYVIQFCVRLDESPSTTYAKMQQAYGDQCLSKSTVLSGTKGFGRVAQQQPMIQEVDDHRHQLLKR